MNTQHHPKKLTPAQRTIAIVGIALTIIAGVLARNQGMLDWLTPNRDPSSQWQQQTLQSLMKSPPLILGARTALKNLPELHATSKRMSAEYGVATNYHAFALNAVNRREEGGLQFALKAAKFCENLNSAKGTQTLAHSQSATSNITTAQAVSVNKQQMQALQTAKMQCAGFEPATVSMIEREIANQTAAEVSAELDQQKDAPQLPSVKNADPLVRPFYKYNRAIVLELIMIAETYRNPSAPRLAREFKYISAIGETHIPLTMTINALAYPASGPYGGWFDGQKYLMAPEEQPNANRVGYLVVDLVTRLAARIGGGKSDSAATSQTTSKPGTKNKPDIPLNHQALLAMTDLAECSIESYAPVCNLKTRMRRSCLFDGHCFDDIRTYHHYDWVESRKTITQQMYDQATKTLLPRIQTVLISGDYSAFLPPELSMPTHPATPIEQYAPPVKR